MFAEICIATDNESEIDLQDGRFFPSLTVLIKQGRFSLTLFKGTCLEVKYQQSHYLTSFLANM